jgi:antimicrobial peptide system SdpA family protein
VSVRAATPGHARLFGAMTLASFLVMAALSAYAVQSARPYNAVQLPFARKIAMVLVLPQGWKFFTRDARESQQTMQVRVREGRWADASGGPNAEPAHLFGASREGRAQAIEISELLAAAGHVTFAPCTGAVTSCLEAATPAARVQNVSARPSLCGSIGVVHRAPIPWAWARGGAKEMPTTVVRLEVSC